MGVKWSVLATVVVLLPAVAGCGSTTSSDSADQGPPGPPEVENEFGSAEYQAFVVETFDYLAEFWNAQLVKQGAEAQVPKRLVSYAGRTDEVRCDGFPSVSQNAIYCPTNTTISWDSEWVYDDLYEKVGEAAVAFLLAHEYGHFVQDKLKTQNEFTLTIESELNADCLAGAWLGKVDRDYRRLTRGDLESLYFGVLDVADPRGTPWIDPSAHGRAVERRQAIGTGFRRGVEGCGKVYFPGFSL